MPPEKTTNSKIHAPVTVHDLIINTYINKLNKPKNINREELLNKLKARFINEYNIYTTAVISGHRLYVLMFDLDQPDSQSLTEPTQGVNNSQHNVN